MEPHEPQVPQTSWLDRFHQSWFPPAAVLGAFAAFTATAWRSRPAPPPAPAPAQPSGGAEPAAAPATAAVDLERTYALALTLGGTTSAHPFRYDAAGRQIGEIGNQNRTRGFILPNRALDFDIDPSGVVYATDSGRHRVAAWMLDGTSLGFFGRFSQREPGGFVGCCNPVNLALRPDGKIVTGEKMVARVKVYEPDGTLLALIGTEHFDQMCIHLHLDVDSKGRILVADPKRREVKVFTWS